MNVALKTMLAAAITLCWISASQATMITTTINVDNVFTSYISTDDNVAGTEFDSGNHWPTTYTGSTVLTTGVTNYLHILARDTGGPAMLIGAFTLSDADFEFVNGTQSMLTGDAGILVSELGFGSAYTATTNMGPNGTSPWGTRAVPAAASYVWSNNHYADNLVYFSAELRYAGDQVDVPEPGAFALVGIGLLGLGIARRRSLKA